MQVYVEDIEQGLTINDVTVVERSVMIITVKVIQVFTNYSYWLIKKIKWRNLWTERISIQNTQFLIKLLNSNVKQPGH